MKTLERPPEAPEPGVLFQNQRPKRRQNQNHRGADDLRGRDHRVGHMHVLQKMNVEIVADNGA